MIVYKLLIFIVLLTIGCTGGGDAPQATQETVATPEPTQAPQIETTPPPTTPPPWAYLFSPSTSLLEVAPVGIDKTKPLTDDDYNFVLKFPGKPADYVDGAKFEYKNPSGSIYVMKFESLSGAEKFFEFALSKIEKSEETLSEKTLSKEGQPLEIYHRTKYTNYFGTLIQKGVFIYYLQLYSNAQDTESYVVGNMGHLFVPDIEDEASIGESKTIDADLSSSETPLADVIPKGAKVELISKNDYTYKLEFPEKTPSYDSDIRASYTSPPGDIYVMRFKSVDGAEDFYNAILSRFQRSENINILKVKMTSDGKSLEAYNKVKGETYIATIIQKGAFIYYVDIGKEEFESESYIKSSLSYLFE